MRNPIKEPRFAHWVSEFSDGALNYTPSQQAKAVGLKSLQQRNRLMSTEQLKELRDCKEEVMAGLARYVSYAVDDAASDADSGVRAASCATAASATASCATAASDAKQAETLRQLLDHGTYPTPT